MYLTPRYWRRYFHGWEKRTVKETEISTEEVCFQAIRRVKAKKKKKKK